jgi:glycosyltransferase involved in cell wall biosynthesis
MALSNEGMLSKYITGVPAHPNALQPWARLLLRRYLNSYAVDIDPHLVRHVFVAPIVRRLSLRLMSSAKAIDWGRRGDEIFDWFVARELGKQHPDAVVCYETAALRTFRAAKRLGITTVLDAPSFHHTWQDRFSTPVESTQAHQRINRHKDLEIELADFVFTVSDLARQSYLEAGVAEEKVSSIPVGVALEQFLFRVRPASPAKDAPLGFVYVGHLGHRKGTDILRDAVRQLATTNLPFTLSLVGRPDSTIDFSGIPQIRFAGWIPHARLAAELPQHDILILPSRHDSFGMVVAEAMACGLPAIVTENVGARELITPLENGLVIPAGDVSALVKAMEWFSANRSRLPAMAAAARLAAERYDWSRYRRKVIDFFTSVDTEVIRR